MGTLDGMGDNRTHWALTGRTRRPNTRCSQPALPADWTPGAHSPHCAPTGRPVLTARAARRLDARCSQPALPADWTPGAHSSHCAPTGHPVLTARAGR
ncbi:hypothetical protein GCM10009680_03680 [Streptomyces yatensis]|uniref:Uncharacterized protein n=1 Tax=Streptomyces yatensis TaxID=155177 RepID=A0ABN2G936_9ACTN